MSVGEGEKGGCLPKGGGRYYHSHRIKTKKMTLEDLIGHCTKGFMKGKLRQHAVEDILLCEFKLLSKIPFWLTQNKEKFEVRNTLI